MNNIWGNRFRFTIKSGLSGAPENMIKVECNNGFSTKFEAKSYTPDDFQEKVSVTFTALKLEQLPNHIILHILRRQIVDQMPATLSPDNITCFFNDIHMNYGGLQPFYPSMKEHWGKRFKKKLGMNSRSTSSSTGESLRDKLNTHFGALGLCREELNRFGGFNWRFNGDDALEILCQSSRNSQYIDCDQFCDAMANCVRRILNPTFLSAFRSRTSHSTSRVPELK